MNTRRSAQNRKRKPTPADKGRTKQHEPAVNEPPQSSDDEPVGSQNSLGKRGRGGDDTRITGREVKKNTRQKGIKRNEPIQRRNDDLLRQAGLFNFISRRPKAVKSYGGQRTYGHHRQPLLQRDVKPEQPEKSEKTSEDVQNEEDNKKQSERQSAVNKHMALLDELMDEPESSDVHHENQKKVQADIVDTTSDESELSDAQSVTSEDATVGSKAGKNTKAVFCPVCSSQVVSDLEDECLYIATQPFKKQSAFCQKHTKANALGEWTERSYPQIDWENIEERIEACLPTLEDIITGKRPSFYRKLLTSQTNEEVNKSTMKKFRLTVESKGLESISTGYYGPRGAKLMVDTLIRLFARKMRKLAPSDDLIKNASVAGFVQAVLVPELTLLFVKEDMNVDDKEARRIIEDSKKIGELLNEQPHDTMTADL